MEMVVDPEGMAALALRIRSWSDQLATSAVQLRRPHGAVGADERAEAIGRAVVHIAAMLLAEADDLERSARDLEHALSKHYGLSEIAALMCGPTAFVASASTTNDNRWRMVVDELLHSRVTSKLESPASSGPSERDRGSRAVVDVHRLFARHPVAPQMSWWSRRPGEPQNERPGPAP